MSLASREALNKLINRAEVAQFATHAEDWSTTLPAEPTQFDTTNNDCSSPVAESSAADWP